MQIVRGLPTFSQFRIDKISQSLRSEGIQCLKIDCENIYFLDTFEKVTATVHELLSSVEQPLLKKESEQQLLLVVVPRLGTISPWSTKATDILQRCRVSGVKRVEKGRVLRIDFESALSEAQIASVCRVIHDRMTESVLMDYQAAEQLFSHAKPKPLTTVKLLEAGQSALEDANTELGLALNEEEIAYLLAQYSALNRDPTDVELMMFAQANSEHCRHKIFNANWTIDNVEQDYSLFQMIKNTYAHNAEGVLSAYKDNAAVIKGYEAGRFFPDFSQRIYDFHHEPVHILMKVETHNHPTAISPFPGAATGSGGEIRDEGATGRGAKPKAGLVGFTVSNLNIPDYQQAWESDYGKPDRIVSAFDIMIEGPIGAAAFNNEYGRPNIVGYFRSFQYQLEDSCFGYHKPIMIAGGMGNIRPEHVEKGDVNPGDKIIVLGGPAMLIGLGGGAASSMASGSSLENLDFASVQRDNPEIERRCQEVIDSCWAMGEDNPIAFIHDVGAGGLSNAIPELIDDGGRGGQFELRAVPNDEPGMSPLEIWCNEAQERYVLAVATESLSTFEWICARERCPYAIVGDATTEKNLILHDKYFSNHPIDIPLELLLGKAPKMHRQVNSDSLVTKNFITDLPLRTLIERVIQVPCVADKGFLITIGDRTVTGLVNRDQMVGPWQVPVADCGVTLSSHDGYTGEAMAMGERSPVAILDAAAASRLAVAEAITNIAAASITRLADIRLSANWMAAAGSPGQDAKLYQAVKALGLELCPALDITVPVGKDSMSMKTVWQDNGQEKSVVSPVSLIVSAFAPVDDVRSSLTPQLLVEDGDSQLILIDLGAGKNRLGASVLAQVTEQLGSEPPDLDDAERLKQFFSLIQELNKKQLLQAYHDRSDGGLFVTLMEMAFAGQVGVTIQLAANDIAAALFCEELGAVVQIRRSDKGAVDELLNKHNLQAYSHVIGTLRADKDLVIVNEQREVFRESLVALRRLWSRTSYMMQKNRDNPDCAEQEYDFKCQANDPGLTSRFDFDPNQSLVAPLINVGAKPKVAILREQGVNGQVEMAAAFVKAGFEAHDIHMTDIDTGRTDLMDFSGFVACGGFSYGDVLGAGQGWAKSILYNQKLREQFERFFQTDDRFVLGVCNGCQMLSMLKSIIPGTEHWPHFKRNASEQYEARLSMIEIVDSASVFFHAMHGSQLLVPVAHGEGRAEFQQHQSLAQATEQKQISAVYVNNFGEVSGEYPCNPNGSEGNVAALCNQDGRVTIMMPHPERAIRTVQHSFAPKHWGDYGPWLRMFENARRWLEN